MAVHQSLKTSKMKRCIFVLSAILLIAFTLDAQSLPEKSNTLRLNWGMGTIKRQDLIFSPVMHQDRSPFNLTLGYTHSHKLEHRIYAKFGRYTPAVVDPYTYYWDTPDELSTTGKHEFNMLDLNYSLGKAFASNDKLILVVGGRSRNRLHQSYYCYGPDWLWHFGYYFSFGLDLWTQASYAINSSSMLSMNLALPIFSYNARSPYMAQDDGYFERIYSHKAIPTLLAHIKDGEFQSWGQSRSLDLDLSYDYSFSDKWSLGASYWFSLNFNSTPVPFRSLEHVFYLSTAIHF